MGEIRDRGWGATGLPLEHARFAPPPQLPWAPSVHLSTGSGPAASSAHPPGNLDLPSEPRLCEGSPEPTRPWGPRTGLTPSPVSSQGPSPGPAASLQSGQRAPPWSPGQRKLSRSRANQRAKCHQWAWPHASGPAQLLARRLLFLPAAASCPGARRPVFRCLSRA